MCRKYAFLLLFVGFCAVNLPMMAMAANWRCGTDINAMGHAQTLLSPDQGSVLHDVHLKIDAVDAFSASQHPGKSFRLADIAFVPEYEDAARAWLRKAGQNRVSVAMLADQPDFLGRIVVDVNDPAAGGWRSMLLSAGLVMLVPETGQDVSKLIGMEDTAIKSRSGMWSDLGGRTAYYVVAQGAGLAKTPTARDAIGKFAVIDGTIKSIEHQEWRSYLNFGSNWREDFTIALDAATRDAFAPNGDFQGTFQDWIGKKVRVRGVIENRGGPYVALDNPFWLCLFRADDPQ